MPILEGMGSVQLHCFRKSEWSHCLPVLDDISFMRTELFEDGIRKKGMDGLCH